jgi:AcrR family transcriptional regulator
VIARTSAASHFRDGGGDGRQGLPEHEALRHRRVAAARAARPVFYDHFASKELVFLEAQEHPTQFILDSCAEGYLSSRNWPARVWPMLEVLLDLIVDNPAISYLCVVECYCVGSAATRSAEEITRSFTFFLEEGYHYAGPARPPAHLSLRAITGAIFEIQVAAEDLRGLARRLLQLAYIAIARFAGAEQAVGLVRRLKAAKHGRGGSHLS